MILLTLLGAIIKRTRPSIVIPNNTEDRDHCKVILFSYLLLYSISLQCVFISLSLYTLSLFLLALFIVYKLVIKVNIFLINRMWPFIKWFFRKMDLIISSF